MNSKKGYLLEKNTIVIQRDLTELDIFAKKFLDTLKKHTDYLVVSGFVSICTGRTRGTEDIDIIIPAMEEEKFNALFKELEKNNFWCYQGDDAEDVYTYIKNLNSIRFAKTNEILYKELILKGKKDIEDAKHLRTFFSEIIKEKKFREYEPIIKEEVK